MLRLLYRSENPAICFNQTRYPLLFLILKKINLLSKEYVAATYLVHLDYVVAPRKRKRDAAFDVLRYCKAIRRISGRITIAASSEVLKHDS